MLSICVENFELKILSEFKINKDCLQQLTVVQTNLAWVDGWMGGWVGGRMLKPG